MFDMIDEIIQVVEASKVSHQTCAEMVTLLQQMKFYVDHKANTGDLYAINLRSQIVKEESHVA